MKGDFYEYIIWIVIVLSSAYFFLNMFCIVTFIRRNQSSHIDFEDNTINFENKGRIILSLIVPIRNEEEHLSSFISSIENQVFSDFEVICIDDHSTDSSFKLLKKWQSESSKDIYVYRLAKGVEGKKKALAYGISKARGRVIVTTDADTTHHPEWLKTIAQIFEKEGVEVYLGPIRYCSERYVQNISWFLLFSQHYENVFLMILTAVQVYLGMPFLANGANFAFLSSLYKKVGGYEGVLHYASGDDMGLLQKFLQLGKVKIVFLWDKKTEVNTFPVKSWQEWLQQRVRWISKLRYYPIKYQFLSWLFFPIYHLGLLLLAIFAPYVSGLIWLVKAILEGIMIYLGYGKLYHKKPYFPSLFFFITIFSWALSLGVILGYLVSSYNWKGRRVM